jgi:phosphoglucomutase
VGSILLTASHNPGGPTEDFGIKFNSKNGGPALENVTNKIFDESKIIKTYKKISVEAIDTSMVNSYTLGKVEGFNHSYKVTIVDSAESYLELMKELFDFEKLKKLISRKDFKILFDGMHGAAGPYATKVLRDALGVSND